MPSSSAIASASTCAKCDMTSSSLACSAGDSSMIRAKVAKPGLESRGHSRDLQPAQRLEDGLAGRTAADRLDERRLALRHLVEEEILLRREVVVDRLLGDAGRCRDLGDGHPVEAALGEEPHRPVGDLLPRVQLLRLAQSHSGSPFVTIVRSLQLQQSFSVCKLQRLVERTEGRSRARSPRSLSRPPSLATSSASGSSSRSSAASPPAQVSKRWYQSFSIPGKSAYEANQRTLETFGTGVRPPNVVVFHTSGDATKSDAIKAAMQRAAATMPGLAHELLLLDRQLDVRLAATGTRPSRRSTRRASAKFDTKSGADKMRAAAAKGLPAGIDGPGHRPRSARGGEHARRRAAGRACCSRR